MQAVTLGTHVAFKVRMYNTNQPSQTQLDFLQGMNASRALLFHAQWQWHSGSQPEREYRQCIAHLKALGGVALTSAQCDTQLIGSQSGVWHTASVWTLPSKQALHALISSSAFEGLSSHASALRAVVAVQPPPMMLRAIQMARTLMRFLPAPAASGPIPFDAISGGVNPTHDQFNAFKASPQGSTIHMFNLLKFKRETVNPNNGESASGKRLYGEQYAPTATQCIFRLGGKIVAIGRYAFTLIGEGGEPSPGLWDEVVVAQYPGRSAFLRMLSNARYQKAVVYREAALERTELWATSPIDRAG